MPSIKFNCIIHSNQVAIQCPIWGSQHSRSRIYFPAFWLADWWIFFNRSNINIDRVYIFASDLGFNILRIVFPSWFLTTSHSLKIQLYFQSLTVSLEFQPKSKSSSFRNFYLCTMWITEFVVGFESFLPTQITSIFKHVCGVLVKCPIWSFSWLVRRSGHFYKTIVETKFFIKQETSHLRFCPRKS